MAARPSGDDGSRMTVALLALALGCGEKDGEGEADRTYAVDRNATKWVAPALVADELIPTDAPLLIGVSWRDDTTIDLSFGLGTGTIDHAGQDPTRVTTSLAEINVVPLVDVMLVLLVIFMVAAPMMQQGFPVKLPQSRRSRHPSPWWWSLPT